MRDDKGAPVEPGLIARVTSALGGATARFFEGSAFFGPGEPIAPVALPQEIPSVTGRQFDYPAYINTNYTPKNQEGVSFATLRSLADNYDLMRIVIETRKDQVEKLRFSIRPKDPKKEPDATCQEIEKFFELPDQEHVWHEWVRMLVEDMLVIDAACLYIRPNRGGGLYALEPVDGATIKRLIDPTGRTPIAPMPAYQQILKGVPAVDYTRDELLYRPRNVRSNRVYGFSPVEQVITTVNLALRRQLSQLSYYTDGATPDLMFGVPETWNSDQIRQFSEWFNAMLSGNAAQRAKARFVPGGVKPIDTKERVLKDEMDEWLARIVCFCFSIPPTAFVKTMNRATSETLMQQAQGEGLLPVMQWLKNLHDLIITRHWSADYHLVWEDDTAINPLEKAQMDKVYLDAGVLHPDEVRADLGYDALTPEQKEDMKKPVPVVPGFPPNADGNKPPKPGDEDDDEVEPPEGDLDEDTDPADKATRGGAISRLGKRTRGVVPIDKEHVKQASDEYAAELAAFLTHWSSKVAHSIVAGLGKSTGTTTAALLNSLPWDDFDELVAPTERYLASVAVVSGQESLAALGIDDETVMAKLRVDAVKYAESRAAELVGRKWVDGELVTNPNAEWAITDSTRAELEDLIVRSQVDGWDGAKLADEIVDNFAFSDTRAEMVSRTEMAFADVAATTEGWKRSGVVSAKRFDAAPDCCDECQDCDEEEVGLDDTFSAGDPPIHPNCRCSISAVLSSDEDEG